MVWITATWGNVRKCHSAAVWCCCWCQRLWLCIQWMRYIICKSARRDFFVVNTFMSSNRKNVPLTFHVISRAHSFPQKNLPSSVGQFKKFYGLPRSPFHEWTELFTIQLLNAGVALSYPVHNFVLLLCHNICVYSVVGEIGAFLCTNFVNSPPL